MKKFIIIGNQNAITYKEIFPYIKENKLWLGATSPKEFVQPNREIKKFGDILWFTNIEHETTGKPVQLTKSYYENPEYYPKYDNYDAINVDRIKDIPYDYDGVMGVPITFLDKYFNSEFQIIGLDRYVEDNPHYGYRFTIKEKETYARVLIKKKLNFQIMWIAGGHSKTSMPKDIAKELNANFEMKSVDDTGNGYAILKGVQLYHRILIKKVS